MSIDKSAGKVKDSTQEEVENKADEHKAQAVNDANTIMTLVEPEGFTKREGTMAVETKNWH